MKKEKGTPESAPNQTNSKGTAKNPKVKILSLLKAGEKLTARQINQICNFNDGRKLISDLRKEVFIGDFRNPDRTKTYFLVPDSQLSLFEREIR